MTGSSTLVSGRVDWVAVAAMLLAAALSVAGAGRLLAHRDV